MTHRHRSAPIALALAVLATPLLAQDLRTVPVAPGIVMLAGSGGNIGVSSGPDGVFLIDDEYAPATPAVRAAVAALGQGDIRFVLNTHWHGDHTGGNENLGSSGVLIVAHDNVRTRMSTKQFIEDLNFPVDPSPAAALPVVTFNDAVTFHLNGEEIHAFHIPPAHTDGDAIVVFRHANVIHSGDVFFNGHYPFIDRSSGGSVAGMLAATDRLLALANDSTRIIPGHGPLATREDLVTYRAMLATVGDRIAGLIAQGKSLDQVLAAKPSAEYDAKWGQAFLKPEQFVTILYRDLQGRVEEVRGKR